MATKGQSPGVLPNTLNALLGKVWRLPPKRNQVVVVRGVRVPMRDGTILIADHYAPVTDRPRPTVLVRCPYGRGMHFALMVGLPYAERGYHVLLQSVRGTFGSGGTFTPMVHEAQDGQDTVAWLRDQPWFDGRLATLGPSYLGFVQWSLAMDPPPELKAMIVHIGPHDFAQVAYGSGPFRLADFLSWSEMVANQEHLGLVQAMVRMAMTERRLRPALDRLPLAGAAHSIGGSGAPWYDGWVTQSDMESPFWQGMRYGEALKRIAVPTLLIGGWHDIFIDQTLEQYEVLRGRGVEVGLTIGPWTHLNVDSGISISESLAWLDAHVAGEGPPPRAQPARVWVGGLEQWRTLPEWPPPRGRERKWYLHPEGRLRETAPTAPEGTSSRFRYDPANPTPSVGGQLMSFRGGAQDNGKLESRSDVLTFTTEPLERALDVLGVITVELQLSSDNPHADIFARLCDVDERGRSRNITDQIVRLGESGGAQGDVRAVRIVLTGTAHRFVRGHRLRLQISGGAHPRFARNLGTGEPVGTSTRMVATTHRIHHASSRASWISLPIVDAL